MILSLCFHEIISDFELSWVQSFSGDTVPMPGIRWLKIRTSHLSKLFYTENYRYQIVEMIVDMSMFRQNKVTLFATVVRVWMNNCNFMCLSALISLDGHRKVGYNYVI